MLLLCGLQIVEGETERFGFVFEEDQSSGRRTEDFGRQ